MMGMIVPMWKYGLFKGCFINGLDLYKEVVYLIAIGEVIVHSLIELFKAGLLFKDLIAILCDVVIYYNEIVINDRDNFIIQFKYGV